MSFGNEKRSVVDDANANIVDAPAIKHTVKAQGISSTRRAATNTGGAKTLSIAATTFGDKFAERVAQTNEAERRRQQLQGAQDQGADLAINEIAEMNKRTGLGEFLFGQSATYEGAQRRAVENNIASWANEELYSVEKHAGMSEEEYRGRIDQKFNDHADAFEGDAETTAMLQEQYQKHASQLMNAWTKEKYVYTQTQNYQTMQEKYAHATDNLTIQKQQSDGSPEGEVSLGLQWAAHYDYDVQMALHPNDQTITKANFDKIQVSNIVTQLDNGNETAYQAAIATGFESKLPVSQRNTLREAHRRWRRRDDINAYTALNNLNVQAEAVTSTSDVDVVMTAWQQNHEKYPEIFPASQIPTIQEKMRRYLAAEEVRRAKTIEAAAEESSETASLLSGAKRVEGGDFSGFKARPKKERKAIDSIVLQSRISGEPIDEDAQDIPLETHVDTLRTQPQAAANAAKNHPSVDIPLTEPEQTFIKTTPQLLYGQGNTKTDFIDEKGLLTAEGTVMMQNLYAYENEHKGILAKTLGEDEWLKLDAFRVLSRQAVPVRAIVEGLNADVETTETFTLPNDKGYQKTAKKRDWLRAQLGNIDDLELVDPIALSEFEAWYDQGMRLHGDQQSALYAAKQTWSARNTTGLGKTVRNGTRINNLLVARASDSGTIKLGVDNPSIYALGAGDDKLKNMEVDRLPVTVDQILEHIQGSGKYGTLLRGLRLPTNQHGRYSTKVLSNNAVQFSVDPYTNDLTMTSKGKHSVSVMRVPEAQIKQMQDEISLQVYQANRRDEIQAERRIEIANPIGKDFKAL